MTLLTSSGSPSGGLGLFFTVSLTAAAFLWLGLVSEIVPEPYLDEVFHIPQAQRYCQGKFLEWDNKITTPPGLYWVSILIPQAAKMSGLLSSYTCDPKTLRVTNALGILVLAYFALQCRKEIEARLHQAHSPLRLNGTSQYAMHTAFNIALFPLLFFFSGLYYTDVVSTAVVLASFLNHSRRVARSQSSLVSDLVTIRLGLFALTMRQTNVFWVVVFMGGLEAVHAVKTLRPEAVKRPLMTTLSEQLLFVVKRWSVGHVHDLPLHMAYPEDMLFTAVSLVIAALCNPIRVLRQTWPYVFVLGAFGGFVGWNGGVVLGDKSNHVATIHIPQMLYIWAFFGFFSLPLFLPYAILGIDVVRSLFVPQRNGATKAPDKTSATTSSNTAPQRGISLPLKIFSTIFTNHLLWPIYLVSTFILSAVIVRFNTIIHPFTLADNRHYMFYVFRYTIRRAPWIRYFLILPYTLSRWLVWGTLSGCCSTRTSTGACSAYYGSSSSRPSPFSCDPFTLATTNDSGDKQTPDPEPAPTQKDVEEKSAQDPLLFSKEPVSTSTGLIFLLATTLSLVTAPLVEPRYFIIPWVIWRLLVPAWRLHDHQAAGNSLFNNNNDNDAPTLSVWGRVISFCRVYDVRLVLETVWFIAINVVTGYIFLFKPYVWRAEDGSILDEGRLQRFMW
ncbi:glycosyltransferase family 59 protein [Trichoderma citrinoviride]|uniref:Dol-P-Glc:Glc(2)Man(9)GlcNAc(2)-PP-Dol alpha-1,2-glucosyltransferase n=1 Tax=Trichoderma citrinoviride TaxID=58853 RepID=A0A2T4BBR4_9HYPO|nr:glycosyltransferase family 59 protein [Trichoderma citrinoviride]PTB66776.1 glycosyltransferase family 59 protein [Trichoderma citrinoviride]